MRSKDSETKDALEIDDYLLMTPGPVQIPPEILKELARPMLHHRTPEFDKILDDVLKRLKLVFQTEERVFIQTATGSGGMESALVNVLSPGDKVLNIVAGKFGERWRAQSMSFGAKVVSLEVPWGEPASIEQVETLFLQHPDIRIVCVQACETSTGAMNPIEELGKMIAQKPNTILLVDGITALGATPLPMDEWGLDVVIGASQKGFMLPTGLAFLSFSKKAWNFVERARSPRSYWDIRDEKRANEAGQTQFSSSVSLIRGLKVALDLLLKEGLESNFKRCLSLAEATRIGALELGFQIFAKSPSPTVTALTVPKDVNGESLRSHLESKYKICIAGGQDDLKGKVIRIGHLGFIGEKEVLLTMEFLEKAMIDLGHLKRKTAMLEKMTTYFSNSKIALSSLGVL